MTTGSTQQTKYLASHNTWCYLSVLFIKNPKQVQNTESKAIAVNLT
jgi:hypothetical protein